MIFMVVIVMVHISLLSVFFLPLISGSSSDCKCNKGNYAVSSFKCCSSGGDCGDFCSTSSCEPAYNNHCQSSNSLPSDCSCVFTDCPDGGKGSKCSGYIKCDTPYSICKNDDKYYINGAFCFADGNSANNKISITSNLKVCGYANPNAPTATKCSDTLGFKSVTSIGGALNSNCETYTFAVTGFNILACGYSTTTTGKTENLYANSFGLGINSCSKKGICDGTMIQLDVSTIASTEYPMFKIANTNDEISYCVYGSNIQGSRGSVQLFQNTIDDLYQKLPGVSTYKYLSIAPCSSTTSSSSSSSTSDIQFLFAELLLYGEDSCMATPTRRPTYTPSTLRPTSPTQRPTGLPSIQPNCNPTWTPTFRPSTTYPTMMPSSPTSTPSLKPTSSSPTITPSNSPSVVPSLAPVTAMPSQIPSCTPSYKPTSLPTVAPSMIPTAKPSITPTAIPSLQPVTNAPSRWPSVTPTTNKPSILPTVIPSDLPNSQPSVMPSVMPSVIPSREPTHIPSALPSATPSMMPSPLPSENPTFIPTFIPTTHKPTSEPTTSSPFTSYRPSHPTYSPSSLPTTEPSVIPSGIPTVLPSSTPSVNPSMQPSLEPTADPSYSPSCVPSVTPTFLPSSGPTPIPTSQPSCMPTFEPSLIPSIEPTYIPSGLPTVIPTDSPSAEPSYAPSGAPSVEPTYTPSVDPTNTPTDNPTILPTCLPSSIPSSIPSYSHTPTNLPSFSPTELEGSPTQTPVYEPTMIPTTLPSFLPTTPTLAPVYEPTGLPTEQPVYQPTVVPTLIPTQIPSAKPTENPTSDPSVEPTVQPTKVPSRRPSRMPTSTPTFQPTSLGKGLVDKCTYDVNGYHSNSSLYSAFFIVHHVLEGTSTSEFKAAGANESYLETVRCILAGNYSIEPVKVNITDTLTLPTRTPTKSPVAISTLLPTAVPTTSVTSITPSLSSSITSLTTISTVSHSSRSLLALLDNSNKADVHYIVEYQFPIPDDTSINGAYDDVQVYFDGLTQQLTKNMKNQYFTAVLRQYAVEKNISSFQNSNTQIIPEIFGPYLKTNLPTSSPIAGVQSASNGALLASVWSKLAVILGTISGLLCICCILSMLYYYYIQRKRAREEDMAKWAVQAEDADITVHKKNTMNITDAEGINPGFNKNKNNPQASAASRMAGVVQNIGRSSMMAVRRLSTFVISPRSEPTSSSTNDNTTVRGGGGSATAADERGSSTDSNIIILDTLNPLESARNEEGCNDYNDNENMDM